jgi:general secretion pathway protein C
MQLYKPQQRPITTVQTAALPEPSSDAAATLFGGQAVTNVVSNYQLTGIVSAGRDSVAILVADGQPPKALKIGRELAPGVSISEVHPKYIMLSEGGVMKRVDLVADSRPDIGLSGAPVGAPQMGQLVAPGAMPATEPQTSPGAVQAPPPGEVNPVVPQGQEPPQEGPPPDVTPPPPPPPPPPSQPQMPPPTRSIGSPVGGQPVSQ